MACCKSVIYPTPREVEKSCLLRTIGNILVCGHTLKVQDRSVSYCDKVRSLMMAEYRLA